MKIKHVLVLQAALGVALLTGCGMINEEEEKDADYPCGFQPAGNTCRIYCTR